MKKISLEKCRYYFDFDEQGNLWWKVNVGRKIRKGSIAGCVDKSDNYYVVGIERKIYRLHRILYQLYHNIELTDEIIDHIDLNTKNNSISNLRIASRSENRMNIKVHKNNKSTGIKNISIIKNEAGNEYFSIQIYKDGKFVYSKLFRTDKFTLEQIIKIRDQKLKELHEEFASFR